MKNSIMSLMLLAVLVAVPAGATTVLRFEPPMLHVEEGQIASMSLMLDDPLDIRTVELWVDYDSDLVVSISGEAGSLFTDSGFMIWDGFEEDEPGHWHGYAVIMGAYDWVTGPGELYVWTFQALADGDLFVFPTGVRLFAPSGEEIEDVVIDDSVPTAATTWSAVKALY